MADSGYAPSRRVPTGMQSAPAKDRRQPSLDRNIVPRRHNNTLDTRSIHRVQATNFLSRNRHTAPLHSHHRLKSHRTLATISIFSIKLFTFPRNSTHPCTRGAKKLGDYRITELFLLGILPDCLLEPVLYFLRNLLTLQFLQIRRIPHRPNSLLQTLCTHNISAI